MLQSYQPNPQEQTSTSTDNGSGPVPSHDPTAPGDDGLHAARIAVHDAVRQSTRLRLPTLARLVGSQPPSSCPEPRLLTSKGRLKQAFRRAPLWRRKPLVLTLALALSCLHSSTRAAKLNLDGKTFDEVVQEAKRTGVVDRALRGILLLRTVKGALAVETKDGVVTGAVLRAEAMEDYDFLSDEKYRCAIMEKRWRPDATVYTIPSTSQHFFLIRADMHGKQVEAQFQLVTPTSSEVADVRFVEAYRGQGKAVIPATPAPRKPAPVYGGKVYTVAPGGDDANPGTVERPFASVARGIKALQPGATLQLRGGIYHKPLSVAGVEGSHESPVTITSFPGERAVIDCRADLDSIAAGFWERYQPAPGVWRRHLKADVVQLWRDGAMQMLARWPNLTKNWTEDMAPEFNGRLPEPGTAWNADSYFVRFDTRTVKANFADRRLKGMLAKDYPFAPTSFDGNRHVRKLALTCRALAAQTGRNFVGAVLEGLGTAAVVTRHEPGADRLEVVFNDFDEEFSQEIHLGRFVLKNHLSCLDQSNEWVFDSLTRTLYVRLPAGDTPERHQFRVKTRSVASFLLNCRNVTLRNLDFVGCAFRAMNSPGTVVEDCVFSYPTYRPWSLVPRAMREAVRRSAARPAKTVGVKRQARVARRTAQNGGEKEMPDRPPPAIESLLAGGDVPAGFVNAAITFSHGGVLRDCELRYYDSGGIEMQGDSPLVENCYLHHGTQYGIIFSRSPGAVARRNTIHSTLSQGAIRIRKTPAGRFTSELNYGYDFGTWRSDASGTQVQAGSQVFHLFRHNWFHHSECKAARFDGQPAGSLGTFVGNVGWRLWQGLQIKGDYQKVFNNTFFSCGARHDISVINQIAFGGGQHCITRNNLCDRISGHRQVEDLNGEGKIPGFHDHNWNGLVTGRTSKSLLRDPGNFDFRPRDTPEVVDAGTTLVEDRFVPAGWLDNLMFVEARGKSTREMFHPFAPRRVDAKNSSRRLFLGRAPDLGAYEYGDRHYWIPGRQLRRASFPIPPDHARYVKADADLMWLEGKNAVAHRVFLGTDRGRVAAAQVTWPEYVGRFTDSNIATPPGGLRKDVRYFWRVDAVEPDGAVLKGPVWTFLPCDGHYEEYRRLQTPANLKAALTGPRQVTLTWHPVTDKRLVGYNLYRRWGNPEYVRVSGERLNLQPLAKTTFIDTTLNQPGKWYYVIEAVDDKGVASEESLPAEVRVP